MMTTGYIWRDNDDIHVDLDGEFYLIVLAH